MGSIRSGLLVVTVIVGLSPLSFARVDLIYLDSGGSWYSRTYGPSTPTPGPASFQLNPEINTGMGSGSNNFRVVNYNNDLAGRLDLFYTDTGSDVYRVRTLDPASPQPGPAFTVLGGSADGTVVLGNASIRPTTLGDYNNSGTVDMLYRDGGIWFARMFQPGGTQPGPGNTIPVADHNLGFGAASIVLGDYNNDGFNDLIYHDTGSDSWFARTYTASGTQPGPGGTANGSDFSILGAASVRPFVIGDYDNDGNDEFIYRDAGVWYAREYAPLNPAPHPAGSLLGEIAIVGSTTIHVGDYNNDGLYDVIYFDAGSSSWWARTYNGTSQIAPEVNLGLGAQPILLANLNNSIPIPEPTTGTLLLVLGGGLLRRRTKGVCGHATSHQGVHAR